METPAFNPRESLMQIEAMIGKARNQLSENGHLYLLWGIVVFICSTLHFLAIQWQWIQQPERVWMLTLGAFVYQTIYMARQEKKNRVKSYTHDILSAVWMVFVGMGALITYICFYYKAYHLMHPLVLALYGMPTILSGVILKTRSLIGGGLACMALSVVSTQLPGDYQLLLIAAAVLVAWIVPGLVLRRQFKAQQSAG